MVSMNLKPLSLAVAVAALASASLSFAGSSETRRFENLDLSNVDEIYVLGSAEVEISQGTDTDFQVRGEEDDLAKEPFFVKRNTLVLGKSCSGRNSKYDDLRFRIVVPHLQELRVEGSGEAYVKPFKLKDRGYGGAPTVQVNGSGEIKLYGIEGPRLEMRVSGSGDIKAVKIDVEEVEAVIAGGGDLYIQSVNAVDGEFVITGSGDLRVTEGGFVDMMEVSVVGSGDARLRDVSCRRAEVNIVGSGSASIGDVEEQLNASILGSGDIVYGGSPEVERVELGSGSVMARNK